MTGRRAFNKRQEEEMKFTSAESSFYPAAPLRHSLVWSEALSPLFHSGGLLFYQSKMGGGDISCDVYSAACCRPTERL